MLMEVEVTFKSLKLAKYTLADVLKTGGSLQAVDQESKLPG
jgi:hypothetical protein